MSPMRHKGGLDITDNLTVSGSVATPTGTFSESLTVSGVPVNIGLSGGGGDVDSVNSVTGAVVIAGAGEVAVSTAGQTITISGTDHSGGGGGARTYTASNGGTDQTISGTTETIITGLDNIAVPGTPDGIKNYRINCSVPLIAGRGPWGYSTNPQPEGLTVVSGASMSSGADESLVFATSVSCFAWWRPTAETADNEGPIFGCYNTGLDQNTIQLSYDKGVGAYQARVTHDLSTNAKRYHFTGLSEVVGEWIFIGLTYSNGDGLKLYANGYEWPSTKTEDNTVSQTNNDDRHIVVCQDEIAGTQGAGEIHSAGFWNAILTPDSVMALYNGGRGDIVDWQARHSNYIFGPNNLHYFRFGLEAAPNIGRNYGAQPATLSSDGSPAIDDGDIDLLFFATPRLSVHMGTTGDLTDAVVYSTATSADGPLTINGIQVTPASGDKITLGFQGNAGGNRIHLGEQATGQFSFLEIEEI
jgi:hypothetical protein